MFAAQGAMSIRRERQRRERILKKKSKYNFENIWL